MNIKRGFLKSLQYAAIGFAIPATVIGLIAIYHFTFHDIHPIDRENDIARLPAMMLIPSLELALLFGLSAFASFAPKRGMIFIRSLIIVAGATMIAVFAMRPRFRRKTVDPEAWLEAAIPIAAALIATIAVLLHNKWSRSKEIAIEIPRNELTPDREITHKGLTSRVRTEHSD